MRQQKRYLVEGRLVVFQRVLGAQDFCRMRDAQLGGDERTLRVDESVTIRARGRRTTRVMIEAADGRLGWVDRERLVVTP